MKKLFVVLLMLAAMNASAQWASYALPYEGIPYTLGFYDLNHGVSLGHSILPFNEYIYYTTNSGASWIQASYPSELRAISGVQYINANTIYACGAENVAFSSNYKPDKDFLSFPKHIRDRYLRSGRTEFYSGYKAAFIKSTNGGLNWQRGSLFDTTKGYFLGIHFFDANTGYALIDSSAGFKVKFYKTINGGVNWQFVSKIDESDTDDLIFLNMNTGFARGYNYGGKIYRTTNAGLNWSVTSMPSDINGITFLNSTTGIAIGITNDISGTNVYRTTNTGNNWILTSTIPGNVLFNNLKSLPNTGTAFAVGSVFDTVPGKITTIKTTNYGLNWEFKQFNPKNLACGLVLVDANNFFMGVGNMGVPAQIFKSTNGGNVFVNEIGSIVPSSYSLSQNYPNPFNPTTKIRFNVVSVKQASLLVTLKVYDVMGREVQTLVNERLQPGTYEAAFDGSALNSGVYFYKLITDGYTETKKMLLIK